MKKLNVVNKFIILFYISSVSRSPGGSSGFNSYTGQLAVNVQDGSAQWVEGNLEI